MLNSECGRALRRPLAACVCVGSVMCVLAVANPPGIPQGCFIEFERSCADIHANTGRICYTGLIGTPCGDIVVEDNPVWDIRGVHPEEEGEKDTKIPYGQVIVRIRQFECVEGVCTDCGTNQLGCEGRGTQGDACNTGGGSS